MGKHVPFNPQMTHDAQSSGISSLQRHVSITAFASNSESVLLTGRGKIFIYRYTINL